MAYKKRGRVKYVPNNVLEELDRVKKENSLDRDCDAFDKIVEHSRVGREVEKIYNVWNPFGERWKRRKKR